MAPLPDWAAWARPAAFLIIAIFVLTRFLFLTADFPYGITWDGDVLTDEGLYSCDAINYFQEGHWYNPMDFNQAINVPVLQFIQAVAFKTIGFGLLTVRLVNLFFSLGLLGVTYLFVRQFASQGVALIAVVVFATNHMFWAFSRIAYAEIPVAFFIMLTMLLACQVKGRWWWAFGVLTSVVYAMALLTKTNALFAAPAVAALVVMQDLDWRRIAAKFVLCSVVFFACMGAYWVMLAKPYADEFSYFYLLNLGVGSSFDLAEMAAVFANLVFYMRELDPALWFAAVPTTATLLWLSREYRRHPLLWVMAGYMVVYMVLYAYYGRYWPRFFPTMLPAICIWAGLTLHGYFRLAVEYRPLAWFVAGIFLASIVWNGTKVGMYLTEVEDTYGEMAADIRRIMDADPASNNVLIGHIASSVSLRNGVIPRNDRYGIGHTTARFLDAKPSYWVSEGDYRSFTMELYHRHSETLERLNKVEIVARYNPLKGQRGAAIYLYRLTPRAPEDVPIEHDADRILELIKIREANDPLRSIR